MIPARGYTRTGPALSIGVGGEFVTVLAPKKLVWRVSLSLADRVLLGSPGAVSGGSPKRKRAHLTIKPKLLQKFSLLKRTTWVEPVLWALSVQTLREVSHSF